ncbi:MAG: hypothetical protein QJ16_C0006G0014 [archaeon GW2011_AR1]|nr:MAG: hypothetical protein QJ16_C0006G0014 [archaeon GW2011_AR1]
MPTGLGLGQGMGMARLGEVLTIGFGTEIIYSFIIILCSLMIYFGTKELYELSSYKGLKYFRQAFLFFAIAYFFRSIIKFLLSFFDVRGIIDFPQRVFGIMTGPIALFIFMYFSSIAIFYLLYSASWKNLKENKYTIYSFHILAFVIAFLSVVFRSPSIYLGLNLVLLLLTIFTIFIAKEKKGKHPFYKVYFLLTLFWILNIIDILLPGFFSTTQILIYLASAGIFFTIFYKVLKKVGSK